MCSMPKPLSWFDKRGVANKLSVLNRVQLLAVWLIVRLMTLGKFICDNKVISCTLELNVSFLS